MNLRFRLSDRKSKERNHLLSSLVHKKLVAENRPAQDRKRVPTTCLGEIEFPTWPGSGGSALVSRTRAKLRAAVAPTRIASSRRAITMDRRTARLRREYIYRKSLEVRRGRK